MVRRLLALAVLLLLAVPFVPLVAEGVGSAPVAPARGHVFVIVLENKGYDRTFGASPGSPYLAQTLVAQGRMLPNYYGTAHASLGNYVAMVSGQGANVETQADCPYFAEFVGVVNPLDGQAVGQGCVYPAAVKTVGDQMQAAGLSWRQYAEDMAASPGAAPTTCRHVPVNAQEKWQGGSATDQYATRHVPFVYFHSVIDDQASCDRHVVDLALLDADLASTDATPNLVFITPDVCSDGHDSTCANAAQPGGYAGIEQFLRAWIPKIVASPAYQKDGAILVTFDEGDDAGACCGESPGYNTPFPGEQGAGGGKVGAVLLSPCVAPGSVDATPTNHYGLLRTLEDNFGLARLGFAAQDGLAGIDLTGCSATA